MTVRVALVLFRMLVLLAGDGCITISKAIDGASGGLGCTRLFRLFPIHVLVFVRC